jgi:hypothetical protein
MALPERSVALVVVLSLAQDGSRGDLTSAHGANTQLSLFLMKIKSFIKTIKVILSGS